MSRRAAAAALLAAAVLACARPGAPGGGPQDRRPPVVVATEPAPLARVDDPGATVRIRFSERISERPARGTLDEVVVVSPRTGPVRVEHESDALRVVLEGGLRPDLVYRVTVLPAVVDLFGNPMTDPFDLVFSTGAEPLETALAGQVLDRITGRPVADATVALLPISPQPDTLAHLARSGEDGLFFFRYVPEERYNLVAFVDRNRNLAPDPGEASGERGVSVALEDTLITDVTVLEPDTSRARLVRVDVEDSTTLRLVFTDYLDPADSERSIVRIEAVGEADAAPAAERVLHPDTWRALQDSLAAAADSAAAAAGLEPPPRASRVPLPGQTVAPPGQERGGLPGGVPLPSQELIALLDAPLVPERPYVVAAGRVTNVNGILLGGGEDTIARPAPPPPPADSAAAGPPGTEPVDPDAPADSLGLPPDGVPVDSLNLPAGPLGLAPSGASPPAPVRGRSAPGRRPRRRRR